MTKKTVYLILALIAVTFLFTFFDGYVFPRMRLEAIEKFSDAYARHLVSKMSLEEKVGQVVHISVPAKTADAAAKKIIETIKPGGIILFGYNVETGEQLKKLNEDLQSLAAGSGLQPLLISTDQEGGRVYRIGDPVPHMPSAMAIGQAGDEDLAFSAGFITAYHLASIGVNFLFAPVLDINNNPANPVIGQRAFGSDPERVIHTGVLFEQGAREGGVVTVVKHFPGHGDTSVDSHLGLPVIQKTMDELRNFELKPFAAAIASGTPAIMTAHILYPKEDESVPATLSHRFLTELLREEMKFRGLVITDAMEMHAISKNYQDIRPAVAALKAGADVILLTSYGAEMIQIHDDILHAARHGEFEEETGNVLDRAVYRQVRTKLEHGIIPLPSEPEWQKSSASFRGMYTEKLKLREEKYRFIQNKYKNVAEAIAKKAIRGMPGDIYFLRIHELKDASAHFYSKDIEESFQEEFGEKLHRIQARSVSALAKAKNIVIFDAATKEELKNIAALASSVKDKKIYAFYYGEPVIAYPSAENLSIYISSSSTRESKKAFADVVFTYKVGEMARKLSLVLPAE